MTAAETPRIQFATTQDGVRIAFTVSGSGPPMLYIPGWVSHVEMDWQHEDARPFFEHLGRAHQLVRFDGRGTGLSDRDVEQVSLETHLLDIQAVVDHLGLEQFSIFAWSQRTPAAIVYAAEHPGQIVNLMLYAPFCESPRGEDMSLVKALLDLIRAEWGVGARTTLGFVHPDADRAQEERSLYYLREASTGAIAARILEEGFFGTQVSEYVSRIQAPTLILHRRGDKAVPPECGRQIASLVSNGRFILLDGDHHIPFEGHADDVERAIDDFLGLEPLPESAAPPPPRVSMAPITVLFTDLEGSTTLTNRLGDSPAQELLREHDVIVRDGLRAYGGSEIKHTGDGIMASFPSATDALECSISIQRALEQRNELRADAPIRVRIGINAGEPVQEEGDLFGVAVQLARRICDHADAGQILASNVVRELVAGKGFLFADQGETALRGFEDPVRVFQVRWQE